VQQFAVFSSASYKYSNISYCSIYFQLVFGGLNPTDACHPRNIFQARDKTHGNGIPGSFPIGRESDLDAPLAKSATSTNELTTSLAEPRSSFQHLLWMCFPAFQRWDDRTPTSQAKPQEMCSAAMLQRDPHAELGKSIVLILLRI